MKKGVYISSRPFENVVVLECKAKKVVFRYCGECKDTRRFMDRDTFSYLFDFSSGDVKFYDKAPERSRFETKLKACST
jgi:hypothetical protein